MDFQCYDIPWNASTYSSAGSGPLAAALNQSQQQIHHFFSSSSALGKLAEIFAIEDREAALNLVQAATELRLDLPTIQVVDPTRLAGARGAYALQSNTIYISRSLLERDSITGISGVITEEIGHFIDSIVNPGRDSNGDEGELFRARVTGLSLSPEELSRIGAEDDSAVMCVDGHSLMVEQDNTLATARDLGPLNGPTSLTDSVSSLDPEDFYSFTLSASTNLSLFLTGLSADADVELLDSTGAVIDRSENSGTQSETILESLSAGRYYVCVYQFSGSAAYNLELSVPVVDLAGNTLATASSIGVLNGTTNYFDYISSTDANDYYRFTLSQATRFTANLADLAADVDLQLLSSTGRVLDSSMLSQTSPEAITRELTAGTYYIRVYRYEGSTSYNLQLTANPFGTDQAGNSRRRARDLGALSGTTEVTDAVGSADRNDYYRFTLNQTSDFSLALSQLTADADVELLNGFGRLITRSALGGTNSESIIRQLAAGTYFIRVFPFSGTTTYALRLTTSPLTQPDSVGNTIATAQDLGVLSGARSLTDAIGDTDTNDYYKFTLDSTSDFSLSLSSLTADADVQLLSSTGAVLKSSSLGGNAAESISQRLNAGSYFARVYPYSGFTNYSLQLNAVAVPSQIDGAGNTLALARNIGALSASVSFNDFVGAADLNDFYRFTLSTSRVFNLTLGSLSADADVALLNSTGQTVASSTAGGNATETITRQLTAGTYYVQVYPYSGTTSYLLTLSAASIPQLDGAGNTLAAARDLGVLNGTQTIQDFVGTLDLNDYYRFSLTGESDFSLSLGGLGADANVELLNSTGTVIQGSYKELLLSELISLALPGGIYFVRVFGTTGDTDYNLQLTATPRVAVDGAGNTIATARNVGVLNNSQTFDDFVGASDTNDFYRIELDQPRRFSLALTGMTGNANVDLLNATGAVLQSSVFTGLNPELMTRDLAQGTYFIRIYPFGAVNTTYRLTLTSASLLPSFSTTHGYGLVNAAAAVARALGRPTFANVADRGPAEWANDMINAPEVWAQSFTGQGVVVAVVDTGVDYNHVDLRSNIWVNNREIAGNFIDDDRNGFIDDVRGWDFSGRDNNPNDLNKHGTHVAGTIAALNNGIGVTGVAYNARIMPVQVLSAAGRGTDADVAAGIRYAADNGARVINLSLGGDFYDAQLEAAVNYAIQRGAFVVMASGNERQEGATQPGYPARQATQVGVAVGAVDIQRRAAVFSNPPGTDTSMAYVVAPGVTINSTLPGSTYGFLSGTSMATPHVAGVVALMLSANPGLTPAQIRQILLETAVTLA